MSEGRRERLEKLYGEGEDSAVDTTVIHRVEKDVKWLCDVLEGFQELDVVTLDDQTKWAIARLRRWVD